MENYVEKIENRLTNYFEIERNFEYDNEIIDLKGKYSCENFKYVLSKKVNLYSFENHEFVFAKEFENLDINKLNSFIDTIEKSVEDFVQPSETHMSTDITGVLVVYNELEDSEIIKRVKKYKFYKSFAYGFKGWTNIKLVLVNIHNKEVITNKRGKEVSKVYNCF